VSHHHREIAGVARHLRGWSPNPPDLRDLSHEQLLGARPFTPSPSFSLRSALAGLGIYDQGQEGSCVLNALCRAERALALKLGVPAPDLARQFAYYATRVWIEGADAADDSGCAIRDAAKAAVRFGTCLEPTWPYTAADFAQCPSPRAIKEARAHQVLRYGAVRSLYGLQTVIERDRTPLVIGFALPAYMATDECAKDGVLPWRPADSVIGGHGLLVEGWETLPSGLVYLDVANSWGPWGDGGYLHADVRYFLEGAITDGTVVTREELPG